MRSFDGVERGLFLTSRRGDETHYYLHMRDPLPLRRFRQTFDHDAVARNIEQPTVALELWFDVL